MKRDRVGRLLKNWSGSEVERFWSKVNKGNDCWIWQASTLKNGYGSFWYNHKNSYAHRYSYELHNGQIPLGKEIDHLCRVRNCVNPSHLDAVTRQINVLRGRAGERLRLIQQAKTHCPKGHEYSKENIYVSPKHPKHRGCRPCRIQTSRNYRLRKNEEAIEQLL